MVLSLCHSKMVFILLNKLIAFYVRNTTIQVRVPSLKWPISSFFFDFYNWSHWDLVLNFINTGLYKLSKKIIV